MNTGEFDKLLDGYLEGSLEGEDLEAFERALAEEPALRAELAAHESLLALLGRVETPPAPATLQVKVMEAVRAESRARAAVQTPAGAGWSLLQSLRGLFTQWQFQAVAATCFTGVVIYAVLSNISVDPVGPGLGRSDMDSYSTAREHSPEAGYLPVPVRTQTGMKLKDLTESGAAAPRQEVLVSDADVVSLRNERAYGETLSLDTADKLPSASTARPAVVPPTAVPDKNGNGRAAVWSGNFTVAPLAKSRGSDAPTELRVGQDPAGGRKVGEPGKAEERYVNGGSAEEDFLWVKSLIETDGEDSLKRDNGERNEFQGREWERSGKTLGGDKTEPVPPGAVSAHDLVQSGARKVKMPGRPDPHAWPLLGVLPKGPAEKPAKIAAGGVPDPDAKPLKGTRDLPVRVRTQTGRGREEVLREIPGRPQGWADEGGGVHYGTSLGKIAGDAKRDRRHESEESFAVALPSGREPARARPEGGFARFTPRPTPADFDVEVSERLRTARRSTLASRESLSGSERHEGLRGDKMHSLAGMERRVALVDDSRTVAAGAKAMVLQPPAQPALVLDVYLPVRSLPRRGVRDEKDEPSMPRLVGADEVRDSRLPRPSAKPGMAPSTLRIPPQTLTTATIETHLRRLGVSVRRIDAGPDDGDMASLFHKEAEGKKGGFGLGGSFGGFDGAPQKAVAKVLLCTVRGKDAQWVHAQLTALGIEHRPTEKDRRAKEAAVSKYYYTLQNGSEGVRDAKKVTGAGPSVFVFQLNLYETPER